MRITAMLRPVFFTLAILAAFAVLPAHAGDKSDAKTSMTKETKDVTLTGEILDLYCYMADPAKGQGADHAKCAASCIKRGLPIGLLVGDDVYLITGSDHESAADMVADFAGKKAKVTGTLTKHNGIMALDLKSIEKV